MLYRSLPITFFLLLQLFAFYPFIVTAQISSNSFYLIDSSYINLLTDYDKTVLDTALKDYHNAKNDFTRLAILEEVLGMLTEQPAIHYAQFMHEKAQQAFLAEGVEASDKADYNYFRIVALVNLADVHGVLGNDSLSEIAIDKSFELQEEMTDSSALMQSYCIRGSFYYYREHKWVSAVEDLKKCIAIAINQQDTIIMAYAYYQLGAIYAQLNDLENALHYLNKSLYVQEHTGNDLLIARIFKKLSEVLINYEQADEALGHIDDCIELSNEANQEYLGREVRIQCSLMKGISLIKKNQHSEAIKVLEEVIASSAGQREKFYITQSSVAFSYIGLAYQQMNQTEKAISYYNKSIDRAAPLGHLIYQIDTYYRLAKLYYENQESEKALTYARKSFVQGENEDLHLEGKKRWALLLSELFEQMGQIDSAYYYHKIHVKADQSLRHEQNLAAIYAQETKDQLEKQKKENQINSDKIQQLMMKDRKKNIMLIIIGGCCIFLLFVVYGIKVSMQKKEQALASHISLIEKEKEELKESLSFSQKELLGAIDKIDQKSKFSPSLMEQKRTNKLEKGTGIDVLIAELKKSEIDWARFSVLFDEIYPQFTEQLRLKAPSLTLTDLKFCLLFKLNFSVQQITEIMNVTSHAVYKVRTRLKSKLNIGKEESIESVLAAIS